MRILFVSEHYFPIIGGSTTYVEKLCKNLAKIGCDVYLVTIPDDLHETEKWRFDEGINIFHLNIPKTWRKERYFPIFLNTKLKETIEYVNPDIVHIGYGYFSPLITIFNKKINKAPVIWTIHNVPPAEHKFELFNTIPPLNYILKNTYFTLCDIYSRILFRIAKYDVIISVSQKTADLAVIKGVNRENIRIIPDGVDSDLYNPHLDIQKIKKELNLEKYEYVILNVAGFIPHKGQNILLNSVPKVLQLYPKTVFIMIGPIRSKEYYNELNKLIKNLKISNNVKLLSNISSPILRRYFHISDVYIQPSFEEGFCISILEGMSYSKPVIGSKTGAIPEFILESQGGILLDSVSSEQISNSIVYLISKPSISNDMGIKARDYVVRQYSWKNVADKTLDLYNELCNNTK
jgi:glycosyltransferase involved in cell wall biosynthesis